MPLSHWKFNKNNKKQWWYIHEIIYWIYIYLWDIQKTKRFALIFKCYQSIVLYMLNQRGETLFKHWRWVFHRLHRIAASGSYRVNVWTVSVLPWYSPIVSWIINERMYCQLSLSEGVAPKGQISAHQGSRYEYLKTRPDESYQNQVDTSRPPKMGRGPLIYNYDICL